MSKSAAKPRKTKSKLPRLIEDYYADLKDLAHQNVLHELGTRRGFEALLAAAGREHGWTLIAEHEKKVNGKTIRPDGTFKDQMNLVRGYWEAKDTSDKLDAEIEKKRKAGYPLNNIIFEDTATAVLYQNNDLIKRVDMKDASKLADLIIQFFRYVEPEIEKFEHAITEFKARVPELASELARKIAQAHKDNKEFKEAFADFFELCRTSLNPNISEAAVDEMLVQHILTERLIRGIFDNPEFVRRNVIAAEVEKVMQAMTSQSFDRNTYLKPLDYFYVSIEQAARTMTDFADKQHFLNTVYEQFFQSYSKKLADTMGIVYTPQEIVDFMCASVEEVLKTEFGKTLASDDVYIIDPCTGTGNFIVNIIKKHISKASLESLYRNRLFANEIMLLPYYIAALNIEHAFFEQSGGYESFEGLCFVDTLDMAEHAQGDLSFMTEKNTERVERQKRTPITVVIGNPPYNANQANENDENKNRTYPVIDARVRETYVRASSAQKTKLYDPYVRFFRWATDRLGDRDGIVCFVTNNSFVHELGYDGLQKVLPKDFTRVYHLDLRGNVRVNPKLSGTAYNVFGIKVGVGITLALKHRQNTETEVFYADVPLTLRRSEKLRQIASFSNVNNVPWRKIAAKHHDQWLQSPTGELFRKYLSIGNKRAKASNANPSGAIFGKYSLGVSTNRDQVVYDFSKRVLSERVAAFSDAYNAHVDRYGRLDKNQRKNFKYDESVKWSRNLKRHLSNGKSITFSESAIRDAFVRPFATYQLYFEEIAVDEMGLIPSFKPTPGTPNRLICCTNHPQSPFIVQITDKTPDAAVGGRGGQTFPLFVYDENGANRCENITDWALKQFREHYKDNKIEKTAIFHYVYGLLHHPGYRVKFADSLRRELPRIPFAPDFNAFSDAGEKLAKLHLDYEKLKPWELKFREAKSEALSYRVEDKMKLNKEKTELTVNKSLTLVGIPREAFDYRLGNRSALDWVIDQYQISTDKRSGITSDPNREDDPKYIIRLVGQVTRVSIETMRIVNGLPDKFA